MTMVIYSIQENRGEGKVFELEDKEITLGRGSFLGVTDKRVSRSHCVVKPNETGIELMSIHINPCFYIRNSDPEKWLKLEKGKSVVLHTGDIFSLLPKQHIYEIIAKNEKNCEEDDKEKTELKEKPELTEKYPKTENINSNLNEKGDSKKSLNSEKEVINTDESNSKNLENDVEKNAQQNYDKDQVKQLDKNFKKEFPKKLKTRPESVISMPSESARVSSSVAWSYTENDGKEIALSSGKKRKLPAWMTSNSKSSSKSDISPKKSGSSKTPISTAKRGQSKTPKRKAKKPMPKLTFESDSDLDETSEIVQVVDASVMTRTVDPERSEVKKDKIIDPERSEVNREKTVDLERSKDPLSKDSSEENLAKVSHPTSDVNSQEPPHTSPPSGASPVAATSTNTSDLPLPPCAYGHSCYRKNPQHFQEFSHPEDPDYQPIVDDDDDSSRPECPYGTSCYRKNPLHQKQYRHTRRVAPKRVAKINASRKANDESSDDDYDLDDSFFNDDESDVDDGASEEEDSDWDPTKDSQTKSQTTTKPSRSTRKRKATNYKDSDSDSDATTDGEDLDNLVSDAKTFGGNRKMWKK